MIAVLFVVLTVSVLSVAYLQLSLSRSREGRGAVDAKRAFYLAEAGLAESITGLRMGRSGNVGSPDAPASFAHGVYWVTAEEQQDNTVLLRSTGLVGSSRKSVAVVVDRTAESIPGLGVFADQDVVVGPGVLVDGYDSRVGTYDEQAYDPDLDRRWTGEAAAGQEQPSDQPADAPGGPAMGGGGAPLQATGLVAEPPPEEVVEWYEGRTLAELVDGAFAAGIDPGYLPASARVSSNADIAIHAAQTGTQTMVLADVTPGPDGTVLADEAAVLSGSTVPAQSLIVLPPLEVPLLEPRGDVTHAGPTPFVVPTGAGSYGTLRVSERGTLVLRGPLELVVEELVVDPSATLLVETGEGEVELFVTAYFGLEQGALVGEGSTRPDRFSLVVTAGPSDRDGDGRDDEPVTLAATGELHAMLYAPHARLVLPNGLELFGSIGGRQVELAAGARVHFDLAVRDVVSEALSFMRVRSWRLVATPDAPIVASRLDPFVFLRLQGVTPAASASAYVDRMIDVDFVCADGHTHQYQGPEHLFDPAHAATITSTAFSPAAPTGPLSPPLSDFENPGFAHASAGSSSPFVPAD
jgi:hypothetical protein